MKTVLALLKVITFLGGLYCLYHGISLYQDAEYAKASFWMICSVMADISALYSKVNQ